MIWEQRFLRALQTSRTGFDQTPDWRAALALYQDLSSDESDELDHAVLGMIDQDYRNSADHIGEHDLFADVMTSLPAGMDPDDLLCVEAAVMVAGERGLGAALFRLNRLMRAPRWHALFPRLLWLNYQGVEAQRKLAMTPAGRCLGAILGMALGSSLRPAADGAIVQQIGHPLQAAFQLVLERKSVTVGPVSRWLLAIAGSPEDQDGQALSEMIQTGVAVTGEYSLQMIQGDLEASLMQVLGETESNRVGVGAIAGAYFGPLGAPRRWTTKLADRERLEAVAETLWAIRPKATYKESEGN